MNILKHTLEFKEFLTVTKNWQESHEVKRMGNDQNFLIKQEQAIRKWT